MHHVRSISIGIAFCEILMTARPCWSHDVWSDGEPVPAWVASVCCGPEDVHHLSPEQVHRETDGFRVDGYPFLISAKSLLPSQDGDWWIFYNRVEIDSFSRVYCFFGPMNF